VGAKREGYGFPLQSIVVAGRAQAQLNAYLPPWFVLLVLHNYFVRDRRGPAEQVKERDSEREHI
jgi:hypothetical protein